MISSFVANCEAPRRKLVGVSLFSGIGALELGLSEPRTQWLLLRSWTWLNNFERVVSWAVLPLVLIRLRLIILSANIGIWSLRIITTKTYVGTLNLLKWKPEKTAVELSWIRTLAFFDDILPDFQCFFNLHDLSFFRNLLPPSPARPVQSLIITLCSSRSKKHGEEKFHRVRSNGIPIARRCWRAACGTRWCLQVILSVTLRTSARMRACEEMYPPLRADFHVKLLDWK